MIKVAMLSYWHVHAWDYTRDAQAHPDTEIVAVWDEDAERGKEAANQLGVHFYEDLDKLLQEQTIDAVIVSTPTQLHEAVMVKAARAGKHIFTEKVIAATAHEANHILQAVEEHHVTMMVSLPRLYEGYTRTISSIIEQGLLGKLTLVRVRLSHNGATRNWLPQHFYSLEQCLGGAMIDLGCHPMYLTRLFMGMPSKLQATYTYITKKEVEDNAVVVLSNEEGTVGIVEAGFVNDHSPFTIEVHGTEGTVIYVNDQLEIRSSLLQQESWQKLPVLQNSPTSYEQWVSHMKSGTQDAFNLLIAKQLTELMEAANESARTHATITFGNGNK